MNANTANNTTLPIKPLPKCTRDEWVDILNSSLRQVSDQCEDYDLSVLQYLSEYIFGYCIHDGDVEEVFSELTLEACHAIITESTTCYQGKSKENYVNYLTVANMTFLHDRITWESSIRNARFCSCRYSSTGIYVNGQQHNLDNGFTADQFKEFVWGIINFAVKNNAFTIPETK